MVSTTAAVNAGYPFDGNYPCSSSYSIGGQVFKNFESQSHGSISLGRALEVSCDTVFYNLAHEEWKKDGGIKPKKDADDWFYKTAHQFGLGEETGIDLPNEVTGRVPDRQWKKDFWKANKDGWCEQAKDWPKKKYFDKLAREGCLEGMKLHACDSVNYSIGQGDTLVTPIQMATIYAAISNGGTLYNPTVGKAVVSPDGKHVQEIKPQSHGKLPVTGRRSRRWTARSPVSPPAVRPPGGSAAGRRTRSRCTPRPVRPRSTASRPPPGSPRTPRTTRSS